MSKFCVVVYDEVSYIVEADTFEEAEQQALEWFDERKHNCQTVETDDDYAVGECQEEV